MFCPCTFLSIVCLCTFLSLLTSYTCTVNRFCVHLYDKLVLCTLVRQTGFCVGLQSELVLYSLVQYAGFVYTCTPTDLGYLNSKLAVLALKVQKAVFLSVCLCLHTICSLIAQSLNTNCKQFDHSFQFINNLSASKSNLS